MTQMKKQPNKRKPTFKQAKAIKELVTNGGISTAEAMRRAGYSPNTALDPTKLTKSKAYKDMLDDAGLTDEMLANSHRELIQASELRDFKFRHKQSKKLVEIDSSDPKWDSKGRDRQFKEIIEPIHTPRKTINAMISKIPGAKLVHVEADEYNTTAYYTVPNHNARKSGQELAYKVKGHMAPERQEHIFLPMTPEEETQYNSIFNKNK